jgi:hypothetical protein
VDCGDGLLHNISSYCRGNGNRRSKQSAVVPNEQIEFLRKTPKLEKVANLYDNLNTLRKYALYRPPANVSFETERKILHYTNPAYFQSIVLGDWFGTLKSTLAVYRKSLLSVKQP